MSIEHIEKVRRLLERGAAREAEQLLDAVPPTPDTRNEWNLFKGLAVKGQERWAESIGYFDRVSVEHPLGRFAVSGACDAHQSLGQHEIVVSRLAEQADDNAELRAILGTSYLMLGRDAEAIVELEASLRLNPGAPGPAQNLATAYRNVGRVADSIKAIEQVLTADNGNAGAHYLLSTFHLERGDRKSALRHAEQAFHLNAFDRNAMAAYAIALAECDQPEAAAALVNYDGLLYSTTWHRPPPGFDSLGDFHDALVGELRNSPSLVAGSASRTTQGGAHSGNLLNDDSDVVKQMAQRLDSEAKNYFARLPKNSSHPYFAWQPTTWNMSLWGVILRSQGYQNPHMHPDGWLSGVYYVRVPDSVSLESGSGCIEFGRGRDAWRTTSDVLLRREEPEVGRLILFPSFYYHRTLPFESDKERICFAFDIRPIA